MKYTISVFLLIFGLVWFGCSGANAAAADDTKELANLFDAYTAAAKVKDMEKMLALLTEKVVKDVRTSVKKDKKMKDFFLLMGQAKVPESYEIQHAAWAKDGKSALLYFILNLPAMEEVERPKKTTIEATVSFNKEKGKWKIDRFTPLWETDKIKRPKDYAYNENDSNTNKTGSVAGRIAKIEYKPDHVLILLRVMDEEMAVFLPPKAELEKAGVNFEDFAPWKMREFTGHPHKTDDLKFFATGDNAVE